MSPKLRIYLIETAKEILKGKGKQITSKRILRELEKLVGILDSLDHCSKSRFPGSELDDDLDYTQRELRVHGKSYIFPVRNTD